MKISFLIFVDGYLFSLNLWYISVIIPFLVFNSVKFVPKDLHTDNNSSINTVRMNFLSIDCSTEIGSLFLKTKNKTFRKVLQSDKSNNDLLMKKILDFFTEKHVKFDDISAIFINQGPGNFSGLRGSLATAKGVSLSKNLNLYGYNTFIWASSNFMNKKDFIYSLVTYRKKYFIQKFGKRLNKFSKIEEITENEIIEKYKKEFKVIPKTMVKNFGDKILKLNNLNIVDLDHNNLELLYFSGLLDEKLIKPLYLS